MHSPVRGTDSSTVATAPCGSGPQPWTPSPVRAEDKSLGLGGGGPAFPSSAVCVGGHMLLAAFFSPHPPGTHGAQSHPDGGSELPGELGGLVLLLPPGPPSALHCTARPPGEP